MQIDERHLVVRCMTHYVVRNLDAACFEAR